MTDTNADAVRQQFWDDLAARLTIQANADRIAKEADPVYQANKRRSSEAGHRAKITKARNKAARENASGEV